MKYLRVVSLVLAMVFLLGPLTGCLGLATGFPAKMGTDGYSAGPVAEAEFSALVRDAVPAGEGELHVFGKGTWHGFDEHPGAMRWTEPYFSGVVVLADANIVLLLWNERERNYAVVERVPYSVIRFKSKSPGASGYLEIDMNGRALSIGADIFHPLVTTYLGFENESGMRIDRERNRQAHRLFEEKVERIPADEAEISAPGFPQVENSP